MTSKYKKLNIALVGSYLNFKLKLRGPNQTKYISKYWSNLIEIQRFQIKTTLNKMQTQNIEFTQLTYECVKKKHALSILQPLCSFSSAQAYFLSLGEMNSSQLVKIESSSDKNHIIVFLNPFCPSRKQRMEIK